MSEQLPIGGIELSSAEIEALGVRWSSCWSPGQVAQHLAGTTTPWCVAAGWALDLFRGTQTREHGDIEIAIPATGFPEIRDRFPGFAFDVVSSGRLWEDAPPDVLAATHQTWLRDRATGNYLLDVFREPHDGETWICRHDETIRLPYRQIIHHTSDGIPYLAPELVLLFKAKHARPKDQADFDAVIPYMTPAQRRTLAGLLARVHPGHRWLAHLQPGPQTLSGGQAVYGPPIPEGHALLLRRSTGPDCQLAAKVGAGRCWAIGGQKAISPANGTVVSGNFSGLNMPLVSRPAA